MNARSVELHHWVYASLHPPSSMQTSPVQSHCQQAAHWDDSTPLLEPTTRLHDKRYVAKSLYLNKARCAISRLRTCACCLRRRWLYLGFLNCALTHGPPLLPRSAPWTRTARVLLAPSASRARAQTIRHSLGGRRRSGKVHPSRAHWAGTNRARGLGTRRGETALPGWPSLARPRGAWYAWRAVERPWPWWRGRGWFVPRPVAVVARHGPVAAGRHGAPRPQRLRTPWPGEVSGGIQSPRAQ